MKSIRIVGLFSAGHFHFARDSTPVGFFVLMAVTISHRRLPIAVGHKTLTFFTHGICNMALAILM